MFRLSHIESRFSEFMSIRAKTYDLHSAPSGSIEESCKADTGSTLSLCATGMALPTTLMDIIQVIFEQFRSRARDLNNTQADPCMQKHAQSSTSMARAHLLMLQLWPMALIAGRAARCHCYPCLGFGCACNCCRRGPVAAAVAATGAEDIKVGRHIHGL